LIQGNPRKGAGVNCVGPYFILKGRDFFAEDGEGEPCFGLSQYLGNGRKKIRLHPQDAGCPT